ncbi:hypothetical protein DFH08DRAFT_977125 [Mycena albidolilacea]|uniref:Uncharacterized protein n=1 Tax=Mycena albidolilacea TaxID=1033008 RepID=A0AAD6Z1C3_9AGAR|nr:hypothetical protein DFH08DRAFT_977125 [Mycena albidolilacea]
MHIAVARGCIGCVCIQTLTACNGHRKQRSAFTVSTLSSSTFFRLAAILLFMAVASLVPTANLVADWMHPVPEPDNLFHADVMALDDIHVMTKPAADFNPQ